MNFNKLYEIIQEDTNSIENRLARIFETGCKTIFDSDEVKILSVIHNKPKPYYNSVYNLKASLVYDDYYYTLEYNVYFYKFASKEVQDLLTKNPEVLNKKSQHMSDVSLDISRLKVSDPQIIHEINIINDELEMSIGTKRFAGSLSEVFQNIKKIIDETTSAYFEYKDDDFRNDDE